MQRAGASRSPAVAHSPAAVLNATTLLASEGQTYAAQLAITGLHLASRSRPLKHLKHETSAKHQCAGLQSGQHSVPASFGKDVPAGAFAGPSSLASCATRTSTNVGVLYCAPLSSRRQRYCRLAQTPRRERSPNAPKRGSPGVRPPSTYAAPPSTIPIVRSRGYEEPRCVNPAA
jgi:hypothetical protein